MKITRDYQNRIITLNQKNYFKKVFKNHNMSNDREKTIDILIKISHLKTVAENFKVIDKFRFRYQFVIDFLIYAILKTRLNIVYAIFIIFRYVFNFNNFH